MKGSLDGCAYGAPPLEALACLPWGAHGGQWVSVQGVGRLLPPSGLESRGLSGRGAGGGWLWGLGGWNIVGCRYNCIERINEFDSFL